MANVPSKCWSTVTEQQAWLLTIGIDPIDYPIFKPKRELAAVAIYLLPVVAFATWGLRRSLPLRS